MRTQVSCVNYAFSCFIYIESMSGNKPISNVHLLISAVSIGVLYLQQSNYTKLKQKLWNLDYILIAIMVIQWGMLSNRVGGAALHWIFVVALAIKNFGVIPTKYVKYVYQVTMVYHVLFGIFLFIVARRRPGSLFKNMLEKGKKRDDFAPQQRKKFSISKRIVLVLVAPLLNQWLTEDMFSGQQNNERILQNMLGKIQSKFSKDLNNDLLEQIKQDLTKQQDMEGNVFDYETFRNDLENVLKRLYNGKFDDYFATQIKPKSQADFSFGVRRSYAEFLGPDMLENNADLQDFLEKQIDGTMQETRANAQGLLKPLKRYFFNKWIILVMNEVM